MRCSYAAAHQPSPAHEADPHHGSFQRGVWRQSDVWVGVLAAILCASVCLSARAQAPSSAPPASARFECGYQSPEQTLAAIRAAVAAGLIADPAMRPLPRVAPRAVFGGQQRGGGVPTVTTADIFPFEDSASLLLTNFTQGQLANLMAQATNALLAVEGDNFDFVGFFLNFAPTPPHGLSVYRGLENTVSGIGQGVFNARPALGVASNQLQGWVWMWTESDWAPDGRAMVLLAHEFEHHWAMFLNPLLDGRSLQGDDAGCGRMGHWNWKVDCQGGCMEIREWIGSNPAVIGGDCPGPGPGPGPFCFNSDIGPSPTGLGAPWSYTDLYLMGYVSPAEMDAGNSELRYMENSTCNTAYNGPISTFSSADIIAANGPRIPDSISSPHDFRTAWIMIHLPGAPPTLGQLSNVVNILNLFSEVWNWGTLGRGTMDNTLQGVVPCPAHDGDMNGDAATDGRDIQGFVDGVVNGAANPALICSGDFNNSGSLDPGDISGMVSVLLGP